MFTHLNYPYSLRVFFQPAIVIQSSYTVRLTARVFFVDLFIVLPETDAQIEKQMLKQTETILYASDWTQIRCRFNLAVHSRDNCNSEKKSFVNEKQFTESLGLL